MKAIATVINLEKKVIITIIIIKMRKKVGDVVLFFFCFFFSNLHSLCKSLKILSSCSTSNLWITRFLSRPIMVIKLAIPTGTTQKTVMLYRLICLFLVNLKFFGYFFLFLRWVSSSPIPVLDIPLRTAAKSSPEDSSLVVFSCFSCT